MKVVPNPHPHDDDLILIEINKTESWKIEVEDIDIFLTSYEDKVEPHFNLKLFGPCHSNNSYGYESHKPCIFLRLNHHKDWVPIAHNFFNITNGSIPVFPSEMSEYLIAHIKDKARVGGDVRNISISVFHI